MTTTLPVEIDGFLRNHLNAQMLKYQAGQTMFCPACEELLDWRNAVSIDFAGATSGKLFTTKMLCGKCADTYLPGLQDRLKTAEQKAGEKIVVSITDGRDYDEEEEYDPAPEPKAGADVTFKAARRDQPAGEQVTGSKVESGLPSWATFYAYQSKSLWHVCESTTGYSISNGDTFKSAVITGFRRLRKVGQDKFNAGVASVPVINSINMNEP